MVAVATPQPSHIYIDSPGSALLSSGGSEFAVIAVEAIMWMNLLWKFAFREVSRFEGSVAVGWMLYHSQRV